MRRHHHLLALLRRATTSISAGSHAADPLHPFPPRNGAAAPLALRFFSSRARSSAGAAKGLIEDEAEFSDWISDLKTGDEGDAASTRRPAAASRGDRGGRDSRGSFSKSRFGGGDFGGDRRGFERRGRVMSSDLDDDEGDSGFGSGRWRRGRGGRSSEFSLGGGRRNVFDNDDAGFRSSRGQRGRGGRGSGVSQRGGRFSDLDEDSGFGSSRGRQGSGGRMSGLSQRRGRGSDYDDEDDDIDMVRFGSPRGRRGRGGRMSGLAQRRGRGSDLDDDDDAVGFGDSGRRQVRGQGGGKAEGFGLHRGGRSSDVDFGHPKPRGEKKFDFGVSEDDDEAEEFDEDVGKIQGNKPICFESIEGGSATQERVEGARDSDAGDSYLSQKRFDECPLSPLTMKGIKAAGYERMTAVQEATLPIILQATSH